MQIHLTGRRNYKTKLIECQMQWTIKYLGLESSKCDITLITKSNLRRTHESSGLTGRLEDMIGVAIDTSIPLPYLFNTVAHEMIHVKQLAKGQLVYRKTKKGTDRYWMGKKIPNHTEYYDLPWEKEAFSKSEIMARRFSDELMEKANEHEREGKV